MPKTNRQELKEVLEELTIYYIQGLRAHAQDIVLSREYSFKGSRRSCAQGLRAHAQDTVLEKTQIDIRYAKQELAPNCRAIAKRPPL